MTAYINTNGMKMMPTNYTTVGHNLDTFTITVLRQSVLQIWILHTTQ